MKGLLTFLEPETQIFIPLSRILYIYQKGEAPTTCCHIALEGADEHLVVLDDLADIRWQLQNK